MKKVSQHFGKSIFTNNEISVINCKSCGYAHIDPLPTQDQLDNYYKECFYQEEKTSYIEEYEKDIEWWSLNYKWLLTDVINHIDNKTEVKKFKMLDVGSGPGLLLHVAESMGMYAVGIEPSVQAYEYSRRKYNLNVKNITIENVEKSIGEFDIITSYLVLEHILNPLEFLKKSTELLVNNGLICIVVPNDFNPIQNALNNNGKNAWWVNHKDHLNYFNKHSLKRLFEKAGLKVVDQNVTFPIDIFLLMGMDYLEFGELGPKCHEMRKTLEFNFENIMDNQFRRKLYSGFKKLNIGRESIIIGRKIK